MVRYRIFGFRVASPFALPDFEACLDDTGDDPAGLVIEVGEEPSWNPEASWEDRSAAWGVRDGSFLLRCRPLGVMELRPEGRIRVSPEVRRAPRLFRTLLTNTLVPAAALQRGHLALHCAAVDIGGQAVALTGATGQGKSTLSLACRRRGHAIQTEDIGVLESVSRSVVMRPGIPYFRLWPDALGALGLDERDWPPVYGQRGKRQVAFPQAFSRAELPLGAIVHLETMPGGDDDIRIEPLRGFDALAALLMALPFAALQHTPSMYQRFFDGCSVLADAVPSYRLRRPRGLEHLDRTVAAIEALLSADPAGLKS